MEKQAIIWLIFLISVTCSNGGPRAFTKSGYVEGTWKKSYNGRTYSAFEGIPYARPPVGNLRFEPPQEPSPWQGTLKANIKTTCLQGSSIYMNSTTPVGSEDCLHINVYVPRETPTPRSNMHVIVYIHAGAFTYGSAHLFAGPDYLMDEDVILVTMNYRLGAFGFLSTEDKVVPGNNGMKDQVLSLKWIQKNIRFFGGNPNSINLSGGSAGGASVHLHYFSAVSNGLFHRGFSEGGTALAPWVIHEGAWKTAKLLADVLDCPSETSIQLVNCFKTKPGNEIAEAVKAICPVKGIFPFAFTPVIEKQHPGAFLTQQPYKMLIDKTVADIPWMLGVAEEQGSALSLALKDLIPELQKNFLRIAPYLLDYSYTIADQKKRNASIKIEEYYFNGTYTFKNLAKLMGDRYFVTAAATAAKLQANANTAPVYFYILNYRFEHSSVELLGLNGADIGPTQGDMSYCYLKTPVSSEILTEGDAKMLSFCLVATEGYNNNNMPEIPKGIWKPVKKGNKRLQYAYIDRAGDVTMKEVENLGSTSFWKTLPLQENQNLL